ncbi:dethiobiotin synthase [Aureibacter tunicatorum]|uniref:ATP-dependent dethiobiotin synthetase BioD n=1 Tax=Aureibacter tunicatorum TaxID=866807 RepID=A0AAE4BSB6_9BACT|nr:dethiobiotin synthase [Aureibacter tunicatorum]MDR6239591.1 dethiobiotin synthetase [Aureibacter tunicatorum]BDD04068.1 ATP-dependent dethiobiotin synthetase BioD 2 [Aureibacter tunicatorum]
MFNNTIFITGIDTDSGKSIVTGLFAKWLLSQNINVITQKIIQTGCDTSKVAEDIVAHREIMNVDLFKEDLDKTTNPIVFKHPASPHLSAALEGKTVDISKIEESNKTLEDSYEIVLLEGAGGLMVPITEDFTTLDFIEKHKIPTLIVSSSKLGSINHTLMSLDVCTTRNIPIIGLAYNEFPANDPIILKDSVKIFERYLAKYNIPSTIISIPEIKSKHSSSIIDFSSTLQNYYDLKK